MKDCFISHASEDKEKFVRPLVFQLLKLKVKVWYDEFELKVGDSLIQSINNGLLISNYGVVVLSKEFFKKNWTNRELAGLTSIEEKHGQKILPIWHNVSKQDVFQFSPILSDIIALNSKDGIDFIAKSLAEKIGAINDDLNLAKTHLKNGDFKSSILLCSTLVEKKVRKVLIDKLTYKYFKAPPIQHISLKKLFELGLTKGIIKGERELDIYKFCAVRNKVLHSRLEPDFELANFCIQTFEILEKFNSE